MLDFFLGLLCGVLATMGVYAPARTKTPPRAVERKVGPMAVKGDGEGDEVYQIDEAAP